MEITTIENPSELDSKPIEDGVMEYGLMQVNETKPNKWAFHVKDCGDLIGGATGRAHFSQFYLDNIWVKEAARSKGIGKSIHQEVVACAERCGCRRIQLNTLNEKAVKFYQRLGYKTLAVIEDYVDGFNLYYMAREI